MSEDIRAIRDECCQIWNKLKDKTQMIDYLVESKQQLAESEEKYKKAYQEGLLQKQFDKDMEIEQLKQQLAEKDKEIERLKTARNCTYKQVEIWKHEFAVERLKNVKEEIDNVYKIWRSYNVDLADIKTGLYSGLQHMSSFIDNQINQLKLEEKK